MAPSAVGASGEKKKNISVIRIILDKL